MRSLSVALTLLVVVLGPGVARGQAGPVGSPTQTFDGLARQAASARQSGRIEDAVRLYDAALERRPLWDEGLWYLGTLHYQADRFAEAATVFRRFVELKPDIGPGWGLLGLCEFEVGDLETARRSLERALSLGVAGNLDLHKNVQWRLALTYIEQSQFEIAIEPLTWLAGLDTETPGLEGAVGLTLLRRPMLPSEVPEAERDLVGKMGRAGYLYLATREGEAREAYREVVEAYPDTPWVHHAYGVFLKEIDADRALAEFRRELEVQPTNVYAMLEVAYELLLRGDYAGAREPAEKAAALAPDLFAARHALGRVLVELGQVEEGIVHLEAAAILAPQVPEMHFALARAYARVGRTEDMEKARARFAELTRRAEGGSPAGDAEEATP
jgi:tetratricopeptide (TPR) repeat protein